MRKNKKLETIYKICEVEIQNPLPDFFEDLSTQIAKNLDNMILADIEDVFLKYGIVLNKEKFMEICKEYLRREEEKRCQDQDF